jgi:sulfoacetaldehyde dehydrogenase
MTKMTEVTAARGDVPAAVGALIERARAAQRAYERSTQEQVDEVVVAVGWALVDPASNRALAELAVSETGLGNVEDKITKNRRKTMGLLRDLKRARTVGVIAEYPERGIVEIARPVGVVGAIVPSTNPVATPFNKVLNSLKGRNAIILAPSPKGERVCARLVELIHDALRRVGAPVDLVQQLPPPVSKELTQELMRQVDLIVATGSQSNVRAAYRSGTPAIGVGAGNVPVIVDESVEPEAAARMIAASKTFDNATSCSSENALIILDKCYAPVIRALKAQGGALLSAEEKQRLEGVMWSDRRLNRDIVAKSAETICAIAGLAPTDPPHPRFLMVEESGWGPGFPFSDEKLSPVLTIYRARDFDHAIEIVRGVLDFKGRGHSVGIHTADDQHVLRLGLELPVCRVIVNQAHSFATGGAFDNGLPFSLSMGCGTWGRNSISDNLNYRHYLNITRISRTIAPDEPTEEDLFGDYWRKFGIRREERDAGSTKTQAADTIRSLVDEWAGAHANAVYLIAPESDVAVTTGQLKEACRSVSERLAALGLEKGDKAAFLMDNGIWTTFLFLGIQYAGRVVVPLNAVAGLDTLRYVLEHSDSKALFIAPQYREKYPALIDAAHGRIPVITVSEDLGPEWPGVPDRRDAAPDLPPVRADDDGLLIYTSGTTGRPKGALLSHRNSIAGGRNTAHAHRLTGQDRALCVLPLYHINGEMVTVMGPLVSRGSVVMPHRLSIGQFWSLIARYRCTWFSVVPTIISYLLERADRDGFDPEALGGLKQLRFGRSASAPLAPEMHRAFERRFGVPLIETMGLTETAAQILSNPLPPEPPRYGSPGRPCGNEAKIIDKNGHELPDGETGELMIRGDNVIAGYYKNPEATRAALEADGWLHTGDLAYRDADGFYFIVGRLKEIIIKGGENIAPREIDEVLYQHPAVLEAAGFAVPDTHYGQEVMACVALKPGAACSAEELAAFCRQRLGDYKAPKQVWVLDSLPKGPSGKIQRLKLPELVGAGAHNEKRA